jgi:hypothetical protein
MKGIIKVDVSLNKFVDDTEHKLARNLEAELTSLVCQALNQGFFRPYATAENITMEIRELRYGTMRDHVQVMIFWAQGQDKGDELKKGVEEIRNTIKGLLKIDRADKERTVSVQVFRTAGEFATA